MYIILHKKIFGTGRSSCESKRWRQKIQIKRNWKQSKRSLSLLHVFVSIMMHHDDGGEWYSIKSIWCQLKQTNLKKGMSKSWFNMHNLGGNMLIIIGQSIYMPHSNHVQIINCKKMMSLHTWRAEHKLKLPSET